MSNDKLAADIGTSTKLSRKISRPGLKPGLKPKAEKNAPVIANGGNYPAKPPRPRRKILIYVFATLALSLIVGYSGARYFQPPWFDYQSPDKDYSVSFRQEPLLLRVPVTNDWSNENMQTVTVRGFWGLDEVNRLSGIRTTEGDRRWLDETLAQTGAELKNGDASDFTAFMPRENVWMRGRIMFSAQGGTLYRIWILRVSEEELSAPSSIRFLYSLKFADGGR